MIGKGYYLSEADLEKNVYIKEETILTELGHFHDGVEFIFMLEGEIEARHFPEISVISAGEIFFADRFEIHSYRKLTKEIRAIVLVLSQEYLTAFREVYEGKTFPAHMADREKNREIISLIRAWVKEAELTYILNLGYSNLLFSKIIRNYDLIKAVEDKGRSVAIKLLKYTNDHFSEDISLGSVSREIGYSKEYCSKIFRDITGVGFRRYLNSLRIKRANELFESQNASKLTALEILYKCGFNSSATFYRAKKNLSNGISGKHDEE